MTADVLDELAAWVERRDNDMHIHRPGVHAGRTALRSERGASLIEYALLLGLIAFVCIGALTYFGTNGNTSVKHSTSCIVTADTATPVCP